MKTIVRSFGVALSASLVLAGLAASAGAAEPAPPRSLGSQPLMAAGVIVKTTGATPSAAVLRTAEGALAGGTDVTKVVGRGANTSALFTSRRISAAEAQSIAVELEKRSDVVSASPNYISRAVGSAPIITNDPAFGSLKHIWDPRAKTDAKVKYVLGSSNAFPNGGYSSKAPSLWKATTGTGEVVAVLDTGITDHPDLDAQILPGWDFVSKYGGVEDTGRDGDGRDGDPHDMGDWEGAGYCYSKSPAENSSWHGTHVSGIIGAVGNNHTGVVGVAPGVKILPVRVLGLCGGTILDIADGIRWAAGLPVAGAPLNANPADVINLSLAGSFSCTTAVAPEYVSAIAAAQSAGVVVVAAAGNDGVNIDTHPASPATCPGVISVGATSEYGDRAGYFDGSKKVVYSNYGASLDISAPGGDPFWDKRGIVSTINTGTRSPSGPAYAEYEGTSMASPVVAAGAALVRSLGNLSVAQTQAALKAAVAGFPSGSSPWFKKCTTSICGKGIIDLSRIPAPTTGVTVTGAPIVNETLTAVPGTWSPKPSVFLYTWLRNGAPIAGATTATYKVSAADAEAHLSVRIAPSYAPFSPITSTSPAIDVLPQGPPVTLTGLPTSTTYGVADSVTVTVGAPGTPVEGPVELRRGNTVLASGTAVAGTVDLAVPGTAWIAGTNGIRAVFAGNGTDHAASSLTQNVAVAKATSTVATKVPTSVKKTAKASITVWVRVPGVPGMTGEVRVYDGTKKLGSWWYSATDLGNKTFSLPVISKTGKHYIKVTYVGTGNISGKTSATKTLTVK